jgi:hypothetical protein
MLLNKLQLTTAMLLMVLTLAAGGTGLTYRAQATEAVNQKNDAQSPNEELKPTEVPKEDQPRATEAAKQDIQRPEEQPRPTEAAKEDLQRPKDSERTTREEMKPSALLVGDFGDWPGTSQRTVVCGAYSITALRTGNAALAYKAATREVKAVRLNATKEQPLWVTPVIIKSSNAQLVALGVKGSRITRVAVFNVKSGKWTPLNLDQPVNGSVWPKSFGPDTPAYEVGEFLYLFDPKTDAWDRLDLRTIAEDTQEPRATKGR